MSLTLKQIIKNKNIYNDKIQRTKIIPLIKLLPCIGAKPSNVQKQNNTLSLGIILSNLYAFENDTIDDHCIIECLVGIGANLDDSYYGYYSDYDFLNSLSPHSSNKKYKK